MLPILHLRISVSFIFLHNIVGISIHTEFCLWSFQVRLSSQPAQFLLSLLAKDFDLKLLLLMLLFLASPWHDELIILGAASMFNEDNSLFPRAKKKSNLAKDYSCNI